MNFWPYFLISTLVAGALAIIFGIHLTLLVYLLLYLVFIISFIFLYYFGRIITKTENFGKNDIAMAIFLIIMKNALVILAFYIGYRFIAKGVVWAVGLYMVQLVIFAISLKLKKHHD